MKVEILKDGNWIDFVIPPMQGEIIGLEAVRVTGCLQSTRGGANYNWCRQGFEIPSGAPYEPFIALEFRGDAGIRFLGWHEYSSLIGLPEGVKALSWGGSLVDAPATVWGQEVIDLSRREARQKMIEAALAALSHAEWDRLTQGGLTVQRVMKTFEELAEEANLEEGVLKEVVRTPVRPLILFNHALFVSRFIGYDNYRLVEVGEGGAVVTSPDHPFEPAKLGEGVWFLSHPIPTYDRVD